MLHCSCYTSDLFCFVFVLKSLKHIGLEGGWLGWAGLGWPGASDDLLVLRLLLTHGSFHVFKAHCRHLYSTALEKTILEEIFIHIRKMNNTIFIQPSFGCLATRAGHRYQQWLARCRLELTIFTIFEEGLLLIVES